MVDQPLTVNFLDVSGATVDRPGTDVCQPCRGDLGGERRCLGGIGGAYQARLYVNVFFSNQGLFSFFLTT